MTRSPVQSRPTAQAKLEKVVAGLNPRWGREEGSSSRGGNYSKPWVLKAQRAL